MPTLLLVAQSALASDYQDTHFWRLCSLQVQRIFGQTSIADLARFAEVLAQVGCCDNELMYNLGDAALERVDELDTDILSVILRAHMLLNFRNDRLVARLEQALMEQMQQSRATASGLTASLLSLSRLRMAGLAPVLSRDLHDAAARMVTEHLNFFTVQQMCEVLEAYSADRPQGDRQVVALLAGVAGALAREPSVMTASNCAIVARAYAKCRVHDERALASVATRLRDKEVRSTLSAEEIGATLYGFAKFTAQDTALLDLLAIEARRCLHVMSAPLIGSVLSSIAKAGVTSSVLTSRAAVQLKRAEPEHLDLATGPELCSLAMAFGKLQTHDEKLFDVIADSFLRRTAPPLAQESGQCLTNVIHAYTKVHITHSKLFGVVGLALLERFEELSLRDLVKYLHGIAKVEYLPHPALQERILQVLQSSKSVASLGVFDLLKLAAAAKRLGFKAPALEAHVSAVLPHEAGAGGDAADGRGPGRRHKATGAKKRRQSCRKRKWSW